MTYFYILFFYYYIDRSKVGKSRDHLYAVRLNPRTVEPNFNAVWQWGIVGLLSAQFTEMLNILNYEVPRPGVNG